MDKFLAFGGSFLQYVVIFVILVAIAVLGVFTGIALRKTHLGCGAEGTGGPQAHRGSWRRAGGPGGGRNLYLGFGRSGLIVEGVVCHGSFYGRSCRQA